MIKVFSSNGIRFSITSLEPPYTRLLKPVYTTGVDISLFDALTPSESGLVFLESTITAVASALAGFHSIAVLHGVPPKQILVLATEAMRRAANAAKILEAIADATNGLGVHILDPPVETLFGAVMGSRSGLEGVPGGALFLDLGGGSVQMTWVDTSSEDYEFHAAMAGESMPYGAAKLTRVLEENPDEIRQLETSKLSDRMQKLYADLCSQFPALQAIKSAHENGEESPVDVYMCGGGFRGYGSMLMHIDSVNPYPIPSINSYTVHGSIFKQTARLRQINSSFSGKIFGLSKRRRRQFPAIATVVEAFIAAVPNIGRVTFCGGSNRQGVLMMKLPRNIRESNPLAILANVSEHERPIFEVMLHTLSTALPQDFNLSKVPTIFTTGLGMLFIREVWSRCGYGADSNTSFALQNSISRDTDCPGFTHLTRALLGLAIAARWGGNLSPTDMRLYQGLRGILLSRGADAAFWAQYLGSVAMVLAALFPVFPKHIDLVTQAVKFVLLKSSLL